MGNWIANDIIAFFISLFLSGIIIPQILLIAFRKKLFDNIDERKIHKGVVPRLGGIAFFPSILFSFALVVGFSLKLNGWEVAGIYFESVVPFYFMICAVLLMFLVGIADDLIGVRYMAKFAVQIVASILIVFSGVYIDNFFGFLWIHDIYNWIGWIVTAFMVVYVVNAINLIDGIDGLASGLSTVAFVFYAIIFFFGEKYSYSMLAAAGAGTLLPFFYYNVFGQADKQKKIFMGDTGALTTGMLLIFCGIGMLHLGEEPVTLDYNPVILGISPLIIPLFDVVRVYIHRVVRHHNPFLPDKSHIHHKLLALGLNQRVALIIIMLWSMFFIVINMLLSQYINPTLIILADLAIWIGVNFGLTRAIQHREAKLGKTLFE
ncbi:MAG: undecaprenyl/decaprenyl-phosphate alpha-N-acetylglucosaminyl 1-phosphate transferase [Muribaculaceae bacterium]|nr:undecaprenyl/decaprenyl-phosphate alpha-N-acetylglucosaminyl 1-phosphate transferase [Muribaculaceae bacterium]